MGKKVATQKAYPVLAISAVVEEIAPAPSTPPSSVAVVCKEQLGKFLGGFVRVSSSAVFAYASATSFVISAMSLMNEDDDKQVPWPYFILMVFVGGVEVKRNWNDDGLISAHNITNMFKPKISSLVLNSDSEPSTPLLGERAGSSETRAASAKEKVKYLSFFTALTLCDMLDDMFVYVELLTWVDNYNDTSLGEHYFPMDYAFDVPIFMAYYLLTWPFRFYGVINPTVKEDVDYPQSTAIPYFCNLNKCTQNFFYVAGLVFHTLRGILPLFLLFPPELVSKHTDTNTKMGLVVGSATVLGLLLGSLELLLSHYYEGAKLRQELPNNKLIAATKLPRFFEGLVKKLGFLICVLHYADNALPISAFTRKVFLDDKPNTALMIGLILGVFAIPAIWFGELKQAIKGVTKDSGSMSPVDVVSSADGVSEFTDGFVVPNYGAGGSSSP